MNTWSPPQQNARVSNMPGRSVSKIAPTLPRLLQSRSTVPAHLLREREEDEPFERSFERIDHQGRWRGRRKCRFPHCDRARYRTFPNAPRKRDTRLLARVKTSSLGDAAGDGLFVTGAVQPGGGVALYPVYCEELAFFGGVNAIFQIHETSILFCGAPRDPDRRFGEVPSSELWRVGAVGGR